MKQNGLSVIAIVLATSLSLLAGCEKAETPLPKMGTTESSEPQPNVKQGDANVATNGTAATPESERESTLQIARQEIDQLKTKIDALEVKAKDASAAMQEKLTVEMQGFEQGLKDLEAKFSTLKDASASVWEDMKASFNTSLDKLKGSVEKSGQQPGGTSSSY
ncbi:MAG: hypothetical protein ACOH2K_05100 [Burkholderiaceae bacterium]